MKLGKTLCVKDRKAWRAWLARHGARQREIWLIYFRKATGKARIPYNDAVEEALCYGWIDSNLITVDRERFAQRFSRRKPGSPLSQMNRERVRLLLRRGAMTRAGMKALEGVFRAGKGKAGRFEMPAGIAKAFQANAKAWANFKKFPASYRRIRVAFVESRQRHGATAYRKALKHLIEMSAKNKRFGFVEEMS